MRFLFYVFLLTFFFIKNIHAQKFVNVKTLHSKFVLKQNQKIYSDRTTNFIKKVLTGKLTPNSEKDWIKAFQKSEEILFRDSIVYYGLDKGLKNINFHSDKFIYKSLECASALYPLSFLNEIEEIFKKTTNKQVFAASVTILKRNDFKNRNNKFYIKKLEKRFKNWKKDPILYLLHENLIQSAESRLKKIPPLVDLLKFPYQKNKTIIFTLLRHDRKYPGLTIIRQPDGKFARNKDGTIFSISELGYSFSNFPGYLKNGNTPQGIFSIVGWYITPTESIGPTPNVLTRLPFEVTPNIFFHHLNTDSKWSEKDYKNLLPPTWRSYLPVYETFYAGKGGRRLLIMHGSADNLELYKNEPYFPHTATQGCLSTIEIWNTNTGKIKRSDQAKLINAFFSTRVLEGFLIVVEINDKMSPISLNEIKNLILRAEQEKIE